jgi:hypothetical protein
MAAKKYETILVEERGGHHLGDLPTAPTSATR